MIVLIICKFYKNSISKKKYKVKYGLLYDEGRVTLGWLVRSAVTIVVIPTGSFFTIIWEVSVLLDGEKWGGYY